MTDPVAPQVALWPAALIVWGPGFFSTPHRHHCVQLIMTLRGSLAVRGARGRWRRCGAALIRADAVHAVDARADTVFLAFIGPESEVGTRLSSRMRGDIVCVSQRRVARWRAALGSPLNQDRILRWASKYLGGHPRAAKLDARVQRVLTFVRRHLGAAHDFSLKALATLAGVSSSRLMHLFTQAVGVPLRPYLRWLRLQRAACVLIAGSSVSTAAYRAGFADAAHLTRTFRRTLGVSPAEIGRRKRSTLGLVPLA